MSKLRQFWFAKIVNRILSRAAFFRYSPNAMRFLILPLIHTFLLSTFRATVSGFLKPDFHALSTFYTLIYAPPQRHAQDRDRLLHGATWAKFRFT
jgi:hypothetical protein